ncbi:MAG: mandelate racemase/muconate lactonizing enzyme family protein [Deltaproteobacteria bacterium]|nr:mandelate racemase/muconate lactonizing enzyme family protein [Deltaproteobacteria bacterium]
MSQQSKQITIENINIAKSFITKSNKSFLIKISYDNFDGYGEATPFMEYTGATVETYELFYKECTTFLINRQFENITHIIELVENLKTLDGCSSPALFAVETAMVDLYCKVNNIPFYKALKKGDSSTFNKIEINSLLTVDDSIKRIESLLKKGVTAFKIKTGRAPLDREIEFLTMFRKTAGEKSLLRLDANLMIKENELQSRLLAYEKFNPEFIEEPADLNYILNNSQLFNIPVAADESLKNISVNELNNLLKTYPVVVVKPAFHGLFKALQIADIAQKAGVKVAVTHMMDGPVAIAGAAHFAFALNSRPLSCGLYPHDNLKKVPETKLFNELFTGHATLPKTSGLGLDNFINKEGYFK